MSGYRELEAFIAGVESLRGMNARVAQEAETPVADVVRANIKKNVDPSGEAWPARADGGKALSGAADALASRAKGTTITLSLEPPYAFHNWGAGGSSTTKKAEQARKKTRARQASSSTQSKFHAPQRQMLPDVGEPLPRAMKEALEASAKKVFEKALKG